MRKVIVFGLFVFALMAGNHQGKAQDASPVASAPFDVERTSHGFLFHGQISSDKGAQKETLLASGACAIAKAKYVSSERVESAIISAGQAGSYIFGEDADPDDGADFLYKLVSQEGKPAGTVQCLIRRRVETGCAFGKCLTAKQFDAYLLSFDKGARALGSANDICGGGVLRGAGECLPEIAGSSAPASGMVLCVETQTDLKGGGKQPASLAFAYGIVPKKIAAQTTNAMSLQNTGCADRGLAAHTGPQGAPVTAAMGTAAAPGPTDATTEARRSRWRLRLPRLPKQPKTAVTDEFSD